MAFLPIRLFNAKRLAQELGRKEISSRIKGCYLAASFLLFIPLVYCGFFRYENPLWSWLSLYQGIAVFVITAWGISASYFASGGDDNPHFITEFTCLFVPVFFTTSLIVWTVYWVIFICFRETLIAPSANILEYQFFLNLYYVRGDLLGLLSFFAVVSTEAIGFYRITKLFHIVRSSSQ
ncbi:MAG: hypothetical protein LBE75_06350 [Burkholderiales bacterium]|jgi:hypothetical protein|nr:hypothetical protein [Burkholderiales bacterium]